MKASRIIAFVILIMFFAFLHVFLQTEIIKVGYRVKHNEDALQELLENNRVLHYNIYALESPYRLEQYVAKRNFRLKHLEPIQVLSVYPERPMRYVRVRENKKQPLLDNAFVLSLKKLFTGKQAEAKTIQ